MSRIGKLIILSLFVALPLFAHAPKVKIFLEGVANNSMRITARLGDEGNVVSGLPIKVISLVSKKVLHEVVLTREGILLPIPAESYIVTLKSKGKIIEKMGIAPKGGFTKTASKPIKVAFYTMLGINLFLLLLTVMAYAYRKKRLKVSG